MNEADWLQALMEGFQAEREHSTSRAVSSGEEPLVSVCVPTYHHQPYLAECLNSVLAQKTDFPFEVILGEDESSDGTRELCLEFAARFPGRLRLFLRDRRKSLYTIGNRMRSFNAQWTRLAARGQYVAMCEGDDVWTDPGKLQRQTDVMRADSRIAMTGHPVLVGASADSPDVHRYPSGQKSFLNELADILPENWLATCSLMMTREVAHDPLSWARELYFGDWPMQVAAGQRGKIAFLPETMALYRSHAGGIWSPMSEVEKRRRILVFFEALKGQVSAEMWNAVVRPATARTQLRIAEKQYESGNYVGAVVAMASGVAVAPWPMFRRSALGFVRGAGRG